MEWEISKTEPLAWSIVIIGIVFVSRNCEIIDHNHKVFESRKDDLHFLCQWQESFPMGIQIEEGSGFLCQWKGAEEIYRARMYNVRGGSGKLDS